MHNAAIILVFHGSRNPQSQAEAAAFVEALRSSLPGRHVSHGFLRECAPGIRDSIVMCPPLIITRAEIDRMIDIIGRSLREAEPALQALRAD